MPATYLYDSTSVPAVLACSLSVCLLVFCGCCHSLCLRFFSRPHLIYFLLFSFTGWDPTSELPPRAVTAPWRQVPVTLFHISSESNDDFMFYTIHRLVHTVETCQACPTRPSKPTAAPQLTTSLRLHFSSKMGDAM